MAQIKRRKDISKTKWYVVGTDEGVFGPHDSKRLALIAAGKETQPHRERSQCYRIGPRDYVMSGRAVLNEGWLVQ